MVSEEIFESDFGKKIWEKYFFFLKKPKSKQEDLKLTIYDKPENQQPDIEKTPLIEQAPVTQPIQEPAIRQFAKSLDQIAEPSKLKEPTKQEPGFKPEDFDQVFNQKNSTKLQFNSSYTKTPTDHEIAIYYKTQGVIDEEALCNIATKAMAVGISFGVEGDSGSGKSFVIKKLRKLLPPGWEYKLEFSTDAAAFNDSDNINKSKRIFIPELQKAMNKKNSNIVDVIKTLTEGEDATKRKSANDGKSVVESTIKEKPVFYTLAYENNFKKDEEASRRFLRLRTDHSEEHYNGVHKHKAEARCKIKKDPKELKELRERLTQHIYEVSELDIKVIDPFAVYFQENLVPKKTQKSVSYVDHYYNLIDAYVKWNHKERQSFEANGQKYIIADLEDFYNVFEMYFREFTKSLKEFAERMDEGEEKQAALAEYVELEEPNWKKCLEKAHEMLTNELGQPLSNKIEEWYSRHTKEGLITTIDYKTGKTTNIVDLLEPEDQDEVESLAEYIT